MRVALQKDKNLWSVVLAGGNGERMRPLVQEWLGRHKPKQYCTFVGTRSMFQHTLDRSDRIVAAEQRVTVVAQEHRHEAQTQFSSRSLGNLILQPANRDTAVGIFLGLTYIRAHDPEATVVIFPSDHFVYPEDRFIKITYSLARAAQQLEHLILLLGVSPDAPEPEYGWIQPAAHLAWIDGYRIQGTTGFLEKPTATRCRAAMCSGALWNTMIVAAKIEMLWRLGQRCLPEMMRLFEIYAQSMGSVQEDAALARIYELMPSCNFSSDLLEKSPQHLGVMELQGVLWSDWGKPERIAATLRQIGREHEMCRTRVAAAAG